MFNKVDALNINGRIMVVSGRVRSLHQNRPSRWKDMKSSGQNSAISIDVKLRIAFMECWLK